MLNYLLRLLIAIVFVKWTEEYLTNDNSNFSPGAPRENYKNQSDLLRLLKNKGYLTNKRVEWVMSKVSIYDFEGHYIEEARVLETSPQHMYTVVLEALESHLKHGNKVLDYGCGYGYLSVCMAYLVGKRGYVIAYEETKEEVEYPNMTAHMYARSVMHYNVLRFVVKKDKPGYRDYGPYDVIHSHSHFKEIPQHLLKLLKRGGRMILPLEERNVTMTLYIIDKNLNGTITKREAWDYESDSASYNPDSSTIEYVSDYET